MESTAIVMRGSDFHRRSRTRGALAGALVASLIACLVGAIPAAAEVDQEGLLEMDLEDLSSLDIEVTSVSKKQQKISESAAAIAVITGEDIRRAGHRSIPEALRMVPGLDVRQSNSDTWAISARGFGSDFANKLLVLIDGRSVYTPLFAGVYWDIQDLAIEDVDRIEVIRGPGGTIWGANAVNGVINIITKRADKTHGTLASIGYGDRPSDGGDLGDLDAVARFGGEAGDLHYRVYTKYRNNRNYPRHISSPFAVTRTGGPIPNDEASEDWWQTRTGFRADYLPESGTRAMVSGEFYYGKTGTENIVTPPPILQRADNDDNIFGGHVLGHVSHDLDNGQSVSAQAYFDHTTRDSLLLGEHRNTADIELQHDFALLDGMLKNIWGVGYRYTRSEIFDESSVIALSPPTSTDNLFSGFFQTEIELIENKLRLTLGTKLENNDYTGWEVQPSGRILFLPHDKHTLWAAVSRAVRTPSQVEDDARILFGANFNVNTATFEILQVTGNTNTSSEKLLAYEAGYRFEPTDRLNFDVAFFFNDYDNLSTTEIAANTQPSPLPFTAIRPVIFRNGAQGKAWGSEVLVHFRPLDWWRLTASYSYIDLDIRTTRDRNQSLSAGDPFGGPPAKTREGSDAGVPNHQFSIRSFMNLGEQVELDTMVYWWDSVDTDGGSFGTGQKVRQTVRLDVRIGYRPVEWLDLSLVGRNLTNTRHLESNPFFGTTQQVPRTLFGKATIAF